VRIFSAEVPVAELHDRREVNFPLDCEVIAFGFSPTNGEATGGEDQCVVHWGCKLDWYRVSVISQEVGYDVPIAGID
jgi:hypothetical protein